MLQLLKNLSVRIKLSLVLGLLGLLLLGTLLSFVASSQAFDSDARHINQVGELRTITANIKLLTRQLAATEQAKRNVSLSFQNSTGAVDEFAHLISRYFTATDSVNRVQFTRFLTLLNAGQSQGIPSVHHVAFVPRIAGDARAAFERSVSIWHQSDFQIYQVDNENQPVPASVHPEYFPIHYIVPFEANRSLVGYDLSSDPLRFAALSQAWEMGQSVMTAPIQPEMGEGTLVQLFTPVYHSYSTLQTDGAKPEQLQGFVVITLDAASMVQAILSQSVGSTTISQIEDVTNGDVPIAVYQNSNTPVNQQTAVLSISILGRTWAVTVPQAIDGQSVRGQLQDAVNSLDQNVSAMMEGAKSHAEGLTSVEAPLLLKTYYSVIIPKNTLNTQVKSFLNVSSPATLEEQLAVIERNADKLDEKLGELLLLFQAETAQKVERNGQISLLVGGIGVLTIVAGAAIEYGILRNLGRVKRTALRLADGDLNARNQVRSKDEIGQIGSVLNSMAESLQESFKTVSESEARYRILAENVADIIAVSDAAGSFTYVSPACYTMLGYTPEEMVGTHPTDYIHPDDLAAIAAIHPETEMAIFEYRLRHKDERFIWAETARQRLDDASTPQYITVTRDITERKAARLEQERLQQQIIEAQKQAIRDLSSPVIPLTDQIIIVPLVGNIDTARARDITRSLLAGISEHHALVAIVDVTGVPLVDSGVADHLNRTIQAARLKGAHTIISGISPAIAETIVDLGIDWSGIQTVRDLQSGLQLALETAHRIQHSRRFSANGFNGGGHTPEQG